MPKGTRILAAVIGVLVLFGGIAVVAVSALDDDGDESSATTTTTAVDDDDDDDTTTTTRRRPTTTTTSSTTTTTTAGDPSTTTTTRPGATTTTTAGAGTTTTSSPPATSPTSAPPPAPGCPPVASSDMGVDFDAGAVAPRYVVHVGSSNPDNGCGGPFTLTVTAPEGTTPVIEGTNPELSCSVSGRTVSCSQALAPPGGRIAVLGLRLEGPCPTAPGSLVAVVDPSTPDPEPFNNDADTSVTATC